MNKKIKFLTESVLRTIKESAENEMDYSTEQFEYVKSIFPEIFSMYKRLKNADEQTLSMLLPEESAEFLENLSILLGFTTDAQHASDALSMVSRLTSKPEALASPKVVYRLVGLIMPSIVKFRQMLKKPNDLDMSLSF